MDNFPEKFTFSLLAAGCFSHARPRGTQGVRVYTPAQAWVPTGLRVVCSGRLFNFFVATACRVNPRLAYSRHATTC